jgi:hypothetical protein
MYAKPSESRQLRWSISFHRPYRRAGFFRYTSAGPWIDGARYRTTNGPLEGGNEKGRKHLHASGLKFGRRQESNLDLSLRRAEFYPLKYSEMGVS